MKLFKTPTSSDATNWLFFGVVLMAIGLAVVIFISWFYWVNKNAKKQRRKRRHQHGRPHNRSLAATGGLPPKRDANQPPGGT